MIGIGCTTQLHAQLPPLFEQYHLNQLVFNPAYAGSKGGLEAGFFLHRHSTNVQGAPGTESFTLHTPLANDNVGLGFKFYHDKLGVTNNSFVGIDYAYRMHISDHLTASIGIEGSIANYKVDYSQLDAFIDGDPTFTKASESYWSPDAGLGVYLHSDVYYVGLSVMSLGGLSSSGNDDPDVAQDEKFDKVATIYGTLGTLITVTDQLTLKPDLLVKISDSIPAQVDVNINFIFNNTLLVGGGYRTNGSISFVGQYIFSTDNKITGHEAGLGYSFNTMLADDKVYISPSHEVFLTYRFYKHNNKFVNPRFF